MNLDELISKYLDGELTPAEDVELRKLLSEDIAARRAFDSYVLIHAALREEAKSILPSEELVTRTEDIVLGKIMAEQSSAAAVAAAPRKMRRFAYPALAAVFLLVFAVLLSDSIFFTDKGNDNNNIALDLIGQRERLLGNAAEISDIETQDLTEAIDLAVSIPTEIYQGGSGAASISLKTKFDYSPVAKISKENAPAAAKEVNQNDLAVHLSSQSTDIAINDVTVDDDMLIGKDLKLGQDSKFAIDITDFEDLSAANNPDLGSFIILDDKIPTDESYHFSPNLNIYNTHPSNDNFGDGNENYFYGPRSEVNLTTFFGTQLFDGGFAGNSPKAVMNFSQSVAYKLNKKQQFGLDFGFTKYTYDYTTKVLLPGLSSGESFKREYDMMEIRETGPGGNYIEFPLTLEIQHQMIWGAGFFDQNIVSGDKFNMNGRVAIGGSNDGPLGYLRIYGKYNLFKWLSLNLGVDGRLFWWNDPAFGDAAGPVKSSLSVIYGFEIKI